MTTPYERAHAVIQAREFLIEIGQDLSLPESIRNEALRLLRHYPSREEVQLACSDARGLTPQGQARLSQETLSRLLGCLGADDNIHIMHGGQLQ